MHFFGEVGSNSLKVVQLNCASDDDDDEEASVNNESGK